MVLQGPIGSGEWQCFDSIDGGRDRDRQLVEMSETAVKRSELVETKK